MSPIIGTLEVLRNAAGSSWRGAMKFFTAREKAWEIAAIRGDLRDLSSARELSADNRSEASRRW